MRFICALAFLIAAVAGDGTGGHHDHGHGHDHGAAAPVAVASAPARDEYGSPQAPVVAADEYGSPSAPVQNNYAAPAAPAQQAPVGNQGYYYYYYPVKQNAPQSYAAPADDNGGLFAGIGGGIAGIIAALAKKKIILIAIGIAGALVLAAVGLNITFPTGRSLSDISATVSPYITQENLSVLQDFLHTAVENYQNL